MEWVWVFHGEGASFSSAVFSSKESAEEWILRHEVSGVLTKMPVNVGIYDWVVASGYFSPKYPSQKSPEFIQRFSSAYLEHFHYVSGVSGGAVENV
ncbi:hypothetical protein J2W88_000582 [Acidovorax delafieldii]|uniref:DUF7710 domain-containing protein n=1 Tax=Acidovorax delafieldii TaxID=47920 RepID=A0AAJ2BTR8_ACIDE|nr:hypothetical protein [Acidovorax delafieldii]MDR6765324.1 hypothetical protein [Acidovorax delafieldii]MDR6835762.1 hypothetical protein [Acidovorax delafieldii]MDR7365268.1 hypothetical protein [Acidovorax delafieldii]